MHHLRRSLMTSFGIFALLVVIATTLQGTASTVEAAATKKVVAHAGLHLRKGPASTPKTKTQPLHQPVNAPKPVVISKQKTQTGFRMQATASTTCPSPTIDMKLLVISADGNEANLAGIKQTLDYLGTPYTVYIASKTPNGLTADKLSSGCRGYYQGVILTDGYLSYFDGTNWTSALSQQEWTNLWTYEATMGIRQINWYTYPNADTGFQAVTGAMDTSSTPVTTKLTDQGKSLFGYLNPNTSIAIKNAYTYLAQPLADGATKPLLTDASGNALAAIRTATDGREALSLTFDSNQYLLHNIVLSYGLVNWVTKGLFLGERHVYMSSQIDDLFIEDDEWLDNTTCGTPTDQTGSTYRMTGNDLLSVIKWQNAKRTTAFSGQTTLTMAFNGYGATSAAGYSPDTLTAIAFLNKKQFYWVSHTYDHTNLDALDYNSSSNEIVRNNQIALALGLTPYNTRNMVTPDVSGLTNANFLKAAYDRGIRYLVSDTSKAGYNNPSPNAGIYNKYQPAILMLPRYPNNLFYNVSTPSHWAAEYNCIYSSFWGKNLTYKEILDKESDTLLSYLLKGDLNPWMFHQPNLRAYDGTHTLLGDLIDLTFQKYSSYYNLTILNPTMDSLGQTVANRMQYNNAGVTASYIPGVSITITAQKAARVPVTGLNTTGAETYGGQRISYVNLNAGQSITLPLS